MLFILVKWQNLKNFENTLACRSEISLLSTFPLMAKHMRLMTKKISKRFNDSQHHLECNKSRFAKVIFL